MTDVFVDTTVLLHAVGRPDPVRAACQAVVRSAAGLHISTETIQEFLFHRLRAGPRDLAVFQTRQIMGRCVVHPLDEVTAALAVDLASGSEARGRDVFIAAAAIRAGFSTVVTTDRGFVPVGDLSVAHPFDLEL